MRCPSPMLAWTPQTCDVPVTGPLLQSPTWAPTLLVHLRRGLVTPNHTYPSLNTITYATLSPSACSQSQLTRIGGNFITNVYCDSL